LTTDEHRKRVRAAFLKVRDDLRTAFEGIEDEAGDLSQYGAGEPGRFQETPWTREAGGGGVMSIIKGRVFEKGGVNFSEVWGEFSEEFAKGIPGAEDDPRFWACGVSLVVHMRNPRTPSAHLNIRRIETAKGWFGGGGDLNPMLGSQRGEASVEAQAFHAPLKAVCDAHPPGDYPRFKAWADEYFYNIHRGEPRGVGGIFYDYLDTEDFEADFAFTLGVPNAFLEGFLATTRSHLHEDWSAAEEEEQLWRRGRYAEFNLVHDRGTKFGLATGGNTEAILMSLPPRATWP
jgi:coproporphyrinogen III oxidase